ncbi:hypothetical protein L596_006252 [Steinernema carpocapsae]|uniref:Uncharacterized protein n=1 Tax=Steinernema carpocapsae TaxID=34508 RepID=A0A4U8V1S0_STECR|nr:hypothetical protein L596_006252 [Steinernema carpocapsae]
MNDNDAILWKLGILTSDLQSPRKAAHGIPTNPAAVDQDDSDSEIIFDQKTLLENQRIRTRTTLRPSRARAEALRWKLTCICAIIFAIGVSLSVFGPNACDFLTSETSYRNTAVKVFVLFGVGYFAGTYLGEFLFLRWNPFFIFCSQLVLLVPPVASLSVIREGSLILVAWLSIGVILGTLDRGCLLLYHALFKERRNLIFLLQLSLTVGLLLGSFVFSQTVDNFEDIQGFSENQTYTEFNNNVPNLTVIETTVRPKKPDSAQGIQNVSGKTEENEVKRKEAAETAEKKKNEEALATPTVVDDVNCTDSVDCHNGTTVHSNDVNKNGSSAHVPKNLSTESSTTTPSTTTTTSTTSTTTTTITTTTTPITTTSTMTATPTTNAERAILRTVSTHAPKIAPTVSFVDSVHIDDDKPVPLDHLQYLAAAVLILVPLIPFVIGFCCCCLPFDLSKDDRIAEIAGDQYLDSDCRRLKIYLFFIWTILAVLELSTVAMLAGKLSENEDLFSVRFTLVLSFIGQRRLCRRCFCFSVNGKQIGFRPSTVMSSMIVRSYLINFFISSIVLVFADRHSTTGLISIFAMGAFGTTLATCLHNWILSILGANTFGLSRLVGTSKSLGMVVAPLALVLWTEIDGAENAVFKLILIGVFACVLLYFFIVRQVYTVLRRRQIGELSSGVTGVSFHKKPRKGGYVTVLDEDSEEEDTISMEDVVVDESQKASLLQECSDYED